MSDHDPASTNRLPRRDLLKAGVLTPLALSLGGEAAAEERGTAMRTLRLNGQYYQQFDADLQRDVPGEGYGGWQRSPLELAWERTAVVVMHAWDCGTAEEYPGWYRAVEYIPRANRIAAEVFPPLLGAIRQHGFRLFHVVGGGDYYKNEPGYRRAVELAGPPPPAFEQVEADESLRRLQRFRSERVFVGTGNRADVDRGFKKLDFVAQARPRPEEGVAENGHQLFALCKQHGINHLIYAGFAINWCLLMSPGGMVDMSQRGVMCSAFRQATTAVENRETARGELNKESGLWRVALAFGFVFDVDDFVNAVSVPAV